MSARSAARGAWADSWAVEAVPPGYPAVEYPGGLTSLTSRGVCVASATRKHLRASTVDGETATWTGEPGSSVAPSRRRTRCSPARWKRSVSSAPPSAAAREPPKPPKGRAGDDAHHDDAHDDDAHDDDAQDNAERDGDERAGAEGERASAEGECAIGGERAVVGECATCGS